MEFGQYPRPLRRPFEGDQVDVSLWPVKPSDGALNLAGDLSDPSQITFGRATKIFKGFTHAWACDDTECGRFLTKSQIDFRYLAQVFDYILDNLQGLGGLSPGNEIDLTDMRKGIRILLEEMA